MLRPHPWLMIVVLCTVFAASGAAIAESEPYTILEVDGIKISSDEAENAWKTLFPDGVAPNFEGFDEEVRQNVLRGLVSEGLLYKEAEAKGVPDRESVRIRLENLKKQIVIQSYIEDLSSSFVTEKALRQAYHEYKVKAEKEEEVSARHILVDSEDKAQQVIDSLEDGKDFAKLAKATSMDKGSAARGGDLGYFPRDKMVKPFAEVAFNLEPGSVSKPVKSDFGWHVIKVEGRRPVSVKSFEEMQEALKSQLRKKGTEHHVNQLISKANVKYYSPNGKRKKLNLNP